MKHYEVLHFEDPVKPIGSTKAQTLSEISQAKFHSAIDYVVAVEDGINRTLTEEEERKLRALRHGKAS
ncbi:MAG: hypothetical protein WAM79_23075 [Candidatus Sulfotelmatobacter sp.]